MTMEVSAHYKKRWDTQVRLRLQSRGNMLEGTVMPPMRIDAEKFYFLRSGSLTTTPWAGRGHEINVQGSDDDTIEIDSSEWDAAYYLYDRDKWLTAAGEEQTRQQQAGNAIGRRADAIIYSEIMAAIIPAENIIGDYSSGITPQLLLEAETKLFEKFTPNDGGIFSPLPPRQYQNLSNFKQWANSEWTGGDLPLTKMTKRKTFSSSHVFQGEQDLFTPYITNSGANLRIRFWHKECVGAGYTGERLKTEWIRQGTYKRWLVNHTIDGAAKVIEPNGIVELRLKADIAMESEILRTQAVS